MLTPILNAELLFHTNSTSSAKIDITFTLLQFRWQKNISCSIRFRELETGWVNVDCNDAGSTQCFCYSHANKTDGTTPKNCDRLIGTKATQPIDCMDTD